MRLYRPLSFALFVLVTMLLAPAGVRAQNAAASPSVAVRPASGSEAVMLTGNAQPNQRLDLTLYARFSRDLPAALLSRRTITTDETGHYSAVVPLAPGNLRNAIVTAVVRASAGGASAEASLLVSAPNVPTPWDDLPPSVR